MLRTKVIDEKEKRKEKKYAEWNRNLETGDGLENTFTFRTAISDWSISVLGYL